VSVEQQEVLEQLTASGGGGVSLRAPTAELPRQITIRRAIGGFIVQDFFYGGNERVCRDLDEVSTELRKFFGPEAVES
jgi:hypothetical protein